MTSISILQSLRSKSSILAFISCIALILGLFISRALISIGMIGLFISALMTPDLELNIKNFSKDKTFLLFSIYFILMATSFFWSENYSYYLERIQIMLPFLILPFSFYSISTWESKRFEILLLIFSLSLTGGMTWSLFHYLSDKDVYDAGYGFSHVIPTPFKNDHIRFSIAVVSSICILTDFFFNKSYKKMKPIFLLLILFAVVYLHILAVKSGLLAFYLVAFAYLLKLIFSKKTRIVALLGIASLVLLPIVMYYMSTSFRMKLSYIQYSYYEMKNNSLQTNVSDEGRLISYRFALESLKENPIKGVGLGDVFDEMTLKFKQNIPNFDGKVLLPHNQFLMAGMSIGLIGIMLLALLQISLGLSALRKDFLSLSIWLIFSMTMMIEPLFETQYGTCLYLFLILVTLRRTTISQIA